MSSVHATDALIGELLRTADLLLAGHLRTTPAGRHRAASLALRTVLEIAIDRNLESALPGLSRARIPMRAKLLCLRHYAAPETALRATAVWAHVCLGCHYHRYELGPTHTQVDTWRREITALVERLTPLTDRTAPSTPGHLWRV